MEFPFGRQTSRDFLFGKVDQARQAMKSASTATKSSLTEGSSRMLDSMKETKEGLFGGLTQGIDKMMNLGQDEDDVDAHVAAARSTSHSPSPMPSPRGAESPGRGPDSPHQRDGGRPGGGPEGTGSPLRRRASEGQNRPKPPRPSKPPSRQGSVASIEPPSPGPNQYGPASPPAGGVGAGGKARPRMGAANGQVYQFEVGMGGVGEPTGPPAQYHYQSAEPAQQSPKINFDEQLHRGYRDCSSSGGVAADDNRQQPDASVAGSDGTQYRKGDSVYGPDPITGRSNLRNPFMSGGGGQQRGAYDQDEARVRTRAEVYAGDGGEEHGGGSGGYAGQDQYGSQQATMDGYAQRGGYGGYDNMAGPGGGGGGGGQLGSDLLPGIPRVPSSNDPNSLEQPRGRDLLAITPTSREALPAPDIHPQQPHRRESDEVYDCSDGDSEATEGCDEAADLQDFGGAGGQGEPGLFRSGSVGSDQSWNSAFESEHMDDASQHCMEFMKEFVYKMFDTNSGITQADKALFGEMCQHGPGRLWFARYVNAQRVESKRVDEQIFYRLVQFFAVCLFECNETEDYHPAKNLMNMCFTYFHEAQNPSGPVLKHFLYSYLKDQPIWQSLRFWNAAFFDAVQYERARRPAVPPPREAGDAQRDDRQFQENITFGQLGTFTCNMRAFGLSKELCLEFLRKQSTIASLRDEQVRMLRENVERLPEQTAM